jgi:hypothetical protein
VNRLPNRRLARHVAGVGWGELRRQIEYKTGWAGSTVHVAAAGNFTAYKRTSLMRRVRRRMSKIGIDDFWEMLSFRLFTADDTLGALNLYSAKRDAFAGKRSTLGSCSRCTPRSPWPTRGRSPICLPRQP